MAPERLHRALARAGVASRRASEDLIRQGRVAVNGQVVTEMGIQIEPERDRVMVDGRLIDLRPEAGAYLYLAIYKPQGYVTTASDPEGRPTVLDLVPVALVGDGRIYPVGRLDYDSEGLLLLTNDGDFTNRMTHPRYSPAKEYHVLVRGRPDADAIRRLRSGIRLDGRLTAPAEVEELAEGTQQNTWLRFILHEGRNRQIRRMCEAIYHPVIRLIRVRIGPLRLGSLRSGQARHLRPHEVRALQDATKE